MKGKNLVGLYFGATIGVTGGFIIGKTYVLHSLKRYMKSEEFRDMAKREFEKELGPLFDNLGSK